MMAAISAARQGGNIVRLLEKNDFLGRKLLATGNGRCNLTNQNAKDAPETLGFFSEIGLLTRAEAEGRVYPYSEQASAVQEILISELHHLQVEILCGIDVQAIEKKDTGFRIASGDKVFPSDAVILATGGKAGPQYGSTGDGYRMAKAFEHTIVRLMPSLVQFVSDQSFFRSLKGVRTKGQVSLLRKGTIVDVEIGEIQFTEDGLSGICVFNLSKSYLREDHVTIDLFPEYSEEELTELLTNRIKTLEGRTISDFFNGMLHKKLIPVVLKERSLDGNRKTGSLSGEDITTMVQFLKGWKITIAGTKGWKEAQVTAGGIELAEVNLDTMESKLVQKLYFAGELLDVDEKCGGYNLQWAWSSGNTAGRSAAIALREITC